MEIRITGRICRVKEGQKVLFQNMKEIATEGNSKNEISVQEGNLQDSA
jgi:hypothetical protein